MPNNIFDCAPTGRTADDNLDWMPGKRTRRQSPSSGVDMSVTPPGWKSKDHDAINLDDDIAPGGVSFHHSFQSDLGEHHAFPILQCVVGSFHEMEAVGIIFIPAGWSVTNRRMMIRTGLESPGLVIYGLPRDHGYPGDDERSSNKRLTRDDDKPQRHDRKKNVASYAACKGKSGNCLLLGSCLVI